MAVQPLGAVLRHIRRLANAQAAQCLSDDALLHSFIGTRDNHAFSELVNRHGKLVLYVCRQILKHEQDAEDAFQATFMVLAKKAESIRKKDSLSSWLYGVAFRTAMKAKVNAAKLNPPVIQGKPMAPSEPPMEAALRELQALLHEEVNRLPEKLRVPFVLCCLEGKSQAEAAKQLAWKGGTVSGRLALARERLRSRLTSRGMMLTTALGALALSTNTVSAVPAALSDVTIRSALALITGKSVEVISTQVLSLADSVMKAMALAKCKGLTLGLAVAVLATGIGWAAYQTLPAPQPKSTIQDPPRQVARENSRPKDIQVKQVRLDAFGDPLPPGAIARVGTMRFRQGSQVYCLAFSPDGRQIASGSYHGDLCLWDRETGKLVRRFVDPLQGDQIRFVTSVAFSPDGEILASTKGKAALWEVRSGKLLRHLDRSFSVCAMAFSPDGKSLALATDDPKGIWIFDPATGKATRPIAGHAGNVTAVAFSKDGKMLASGGADKTARIWDFVTGKELHRFEPQVDRLDRQERVMDVALAPDNKLLVVQTTKQVSSWEVSTGMEVHRFPAERQLWSLAFSPDGTRLASANLIWDVKTGQEIGRLEGLPSVGSAFEQRKTVVPVSGSLGGIVTGALAFPPDGKALASGGYDGVIRLHDPANGKELPPPIESAWNRGTMWVCGFAPDGRWLALRDNNGIHICETSTGKEIRRLTQKDNDGVSLAPPVALSPDGKTLVAVGAKAIYRWDTATGRELDRIPRATKGEDVEVPAATIAFAADGKTFACAHYESTIRLWDSITGKQLDELNTEESGFSQLFFAPNGKSLFSEALNHTIQHWDLATHKELDSWQLPFGWIQAFSPDGKTLAVGGNRRGVRGQEPDLVLCDLTSGKQMQRFAGIKANYCAFSADGRFLAVDADPYYYPDQARTIQVLEVASGEVQVQFAGHFGFPGQMAFSADGRMLATGSSDSTALIWDVTGQKK